MFKNMKIVTRLAVGFSTLLVLIIILIVVEINSLGRINQNLYEIVNVENARTYLADNMINNAKETAIDVRSIIIFKYNNLSEDSVINMKDLITKTRALYLKNAIQLRELTPDNEVRLTGQLDKIKTSIDSAWKYQDKVIQLILAGKVSESSSLMVGKAYPYVLQWIDNINGIVRMEKENLNQRYIEAQDMYSRVRTIMLILGLFSIVIAVVIGLTIARSITKPLNSAVNLVLTRDLTVDLSEYENSSSELAQMIKSFSKDISERLKLEKELLSYRDKLEEMVKQRTLELSNVLLEVKETVNVIAASSAQILTATTQVASGTVESASAISETTATVEEVLQAAKLSAQKAKNVADSAQKVVQVSQNGEEAVDETINVMNLIREQMNSIAQAIVRMSEQSQAIGGIIATVTDIADQSNLLAVNAAIEAAKAGEQGKGFAVVAQEIKNLASQSKQATSEVRKILNDVQKATGVAVMAIEQGTKAVEAGVKQSSHAGEAIHILAESINEAVHASIQIVASSQQQVVGMDQVGVAMHNINQAGTEIAVSMVQSEKSAKNLHDMGQKLKDLVERFKE